MEGMEKDKKEMSPAMCAKAGKCMMAEMMDKMKIPPKDEYMEMSNEDKDKTDEKEVMEKM